MATKLGKWFAVCVVVLAIAVSHPVYAADPLGDWNFDGWYLDGGNIIVPNLGTAGASSNALGTSASVAVEPNYVGLSFVKTPWGIGANTKRASTTVGGYVTMPVPVEESFTFEAWVKGNTPNWSDDGGIVSARGNNGFIFHPNKNTRNVTSYIFGSTGGYGNTATTAVSDIAQWHHYALSFDNASQQAVIYVDGVPVVTSTLNTVSRTAGGMMDLFMSKDANLDRFTNATYDNAKYYGSALSAAEVWDSYHTAFNAIQHAGFSKNTFSGVADLDLSGVFPYAVNFGYKNTDNAWQVSDDVTFQGESYYGVNMDAFPHANPWGTRPYFGGDQTTNPEDYNLEEVCKSIRYGASNGSNNLAVNLDTTPGQVYKLQLLVSSNETVGNVRSFDLIMEGRKYLDEYNPRLEQTYDGSTANTGMVLTYEFLATDGSFNILMPNGVLGTNNEGVLNALTLEHMVDSRTRAVPVSSVADLNLGRAGDVVYAVNVGSSDSVTVGGLEFKGDDSFGTNVTMRSSDRGNVATWAAPDTGDDGMNTLFDTLRWDTSGNTFYDGVEVNLAVTAGHTYLLDMIFNEGDPVAKRGFDILLDEILVASNFQPEEIINLESDAAGAMLTLEYTAVDDMLNVLLAHSGMARNGDPTLSGVMLWDLGSSSSQTPEPATWAMLILGVAMLAAWRRRKI